MFLTHLRGTILCKHLIPVPLKSHFSSSLQRWLSSSKAKQVQSPLSYAHGASSTPLLGKTIGAQFDSTVHSFPNQPSIIVDSQDIGYTYAELQQIVNTLCMGLMAIGMEKGEKLGIWAPNCFEWLLLQIATAKLGIILVNLNPAYRLTELEYALNKVQCKLLVCARSFKTSNYLKMIHELAPELEHCQPMNLLSSRLPYLRGVVQIRDEKNETGEQYPRTRGVLDFHRDLLNLSPAIDNEKLSIIASTLQIDDPINIQFTSGTTGKPKAATLTHHNILNNGFFVGERLQYTENDIVCVPVPLYHCFGMVMGNLACIAHGSAIVYPGRGFNALDVLKSVPKHKCTSLYGVPTMFIAMLNHPDFHKFDLSSLRTGIMAGSICPIEVCRRVMDDMHMKEVQICYGMTETSPVSIQTNPHDTIEKRVATVGTVQDHLEIKIVDSNGYIVPRGVTGELLTRGYSVMLGYYNDKEKTEEAIDRTKWMHTGDLGVMDEQGYVSIVGRIKDMLIRGGENVYPREVEDFLYKHEDIFDVQVIGVPDEKYGEEVCAWIILKEHAKGKITAEDIKEYCKDRIAHFKIPRYIKFVDQFPMTVTGKVQKYLMREQMIEELGLNRDVLSKETTK
jgi:fatty-acyl-CoA synthase